MCRNAFLNVYNDKQKKHYLSRHAEEEWGHKAVIDQDCLQYIKSYCPVASLSQNSSWISQPRPALRFECELQDTVVPPEYSFQMITTARQLTNYIKLCFMFEKMKIIGAR